MKLLGCKQCNDIFSLEEYLKACKCKKTMGIYLSDGGYAAYAGRHSFPIGFANQSFIRSIQNQPEFSPGEMFEAFIIPKTCKTFSKLRVKDFKALLK